MSLCYTTGGTRQAPIIATGGEGKGKNPAEQQEHIDAIQDEEIANAEIPTGTQNNLGASSDNGKYANGAGSGSYGNTGASKSYTESNEVITVVMTVGISPSQGYYSTGDVLDFTYEALTYTNVGGMLDVGYQYYNGDISGYEAAGLGVGVRLRGIKLLEKGIIYLIVMEH